MVQSHSRTPGKELLTSLLPVSDASSMKVTSTCVHVCGWEGLKGTEIATTCFDLHWMLASPCHPVWP